jgi:hypothetical protein
MEIPSPTPAVTDSIITVDAMVLPTAAKNPKIMLRLLSGKSILGVCETPEPA